ncbi:hypothetical protein J437_LFUL015411 [Ladona fulva]|uniref:Uncharacterized protein n=1 Tax=Ladona fulva TaxID=123851 RepID=A0A8K0KKM3_LADFU|nr:hypothetical protein J437_LFUL015411 [Ladona fulva]
MGKFSRKEFLITLAEMLIENFRKDFQMSQGRPSKSPKPSHLTEKHFPDVVPPTTKKCPSRGCVTLGPHTWSDLHELTQDRD